MTDVAQLIKAKWYQVEVIRRENETVSIVKRHYFDCFCGGVLTLFESQP